MDVQRMKPIIPFQAGSPMMIIGPTNCGKTYWINHLLTNDMFTQLVASILYCYGMYQEFFNTMREDPSIACLMHFQEGLSMRQEIDNMYDKHFYIIVLDDLMEKIIIIHQILPSQEHNHYHGVTECLSKRSQCMYHLSQPTHLHTVCQQEG